MQKTGNLLKEQNITLSGTPQTISTDEFSGNEPSVRKWEKKKLRRNRLQRSPGENMTAKRWEEARWSAEENPMFTVVDQNGNYESLETEIENIYLNENHEKITRKSTKNR